MMNDRFYEPIAEESGRIGVLGHGYTGAAHPLGAAVALENIAIIEERNLVEQASENGAYFLKKLHGFADHPLMGEVRGVGLIAAIELVLDKETKSAGNTPGTLGNLMNKTLLENGVITRNMMDTCAFCPPLIITRSEIDTLVSAIDKSLNEVQAQVGK